MPPVEIESDLQQRREDVYALLFRIDDFAYSEGLRGLFAIDPAFDDRPCYIAPSKDVVKLELFQRLPEVDLPPAVHATAWKALEAVLRSLMSDQTLLTLVRGEPRPGSVSFGYHASASYDAVTRVLEERIAVKHLREVRASVASVWQPITERERAASLAGERAAGDESVARDITRWVLGERAWDPSWTDDALTAGVMALEIARTFNASSDADRRIADKLLEIPGWFEGWIRALPADPFRNHFDAVRAFALDSGRMSDDELLARCIFARGGQSESGAWWWTLGQLSDKERVEHVLHGMHSADTGVANLVELAKSAKSSIPVVLDYVRAIGAAKPSWRDIVQSGLG